MTGTRLIPLVLRAAGTLAGATIAWAVLGYLMTIPLGAIYGWSGHPAIPAAPWPVYVALYFAVLPAVCLAAAWILIGRLPGVKS